jgi:DNA-binding NarL/FixJ family response regulator
MKSSFVRVSKREQEVLDLLLEGRADKEIASELRISCSTVRSNVARLHEKFGTGTRAQLGRAALGLEPAGGRVGH